ncbi:SET domain-containing protein [Schizophyllum commune]
MRGLLSDEELKYKGPIVECNAHCTCSSDCVNKAYKVVQRGQTVNMHIKKTSTKGWALFNADTTIHRGQYIGTFAGELIDTEEADRRESNVSHVFGLDFWFLNRSLWHRFVAAHNLTGPQFTKFINHSCDPNLTVVGVYIDHSIDVPRITFFADRRIDPGEELCISYVDTPGKEEENSNIQYRECHCNSARCKGARNIAEDAESHRKQVDFLSN